MSAVLPNATDDHDDLLAALGWTGPAAVIQYRGHPTLDRAELGADDAGDVDPARCVKSLCRSLDCWPSDLTFELDPARGDGPHRPGAAAMAYVVLAGERVALVRGCSFAWLTVAATVLDKAGWRPGLNRDVVDPAGWERTS